VSRLAATAALVAIPSLSREEKALATVIEGQLRGAAHLTVERIGDNVVARTTGHHARRVIVAGHLDTVPGDPTEAVLSKDRLTGLGACDMKGSLAVMIEAACDPGPRRVEVTWIFYAREEIARAESGLLELAELRPELLVGDVAVVAEPTGGAVEAGCQGSLRVELLLRGHRAHTSRPFTGRNALHRLGAVMAHIGTYQPRVAVVDGIAYTEQLQVVFASGGVANNVVPDEGRCVVNYRVAPDRDMATAQSALREFLGDRLESADEMIVRDWAPPAAPHLGDPLIAELIAMTGQVPRAKVGWTDVATFAERGIPAANFGAGDPLLAHQAGEFVTATELDVFANGLRGLLFV
jgi:succinyl-diaminopimelate desuccinylase